VTPQLVRSVFMMLSKLAAHLAPTAGRQDVASANPVLGDGISTNLHGNGEPACPSLPACLRCRTIARRQCVALPAQYQCHRRQQLECAPPPAAADARAATACHLGQLRS
jgi:hypothetical protein